MLPPSPPLPKQLPRRHQFTVPPWRSVADPIYPAFLVSIPIGLRDVVRADHREAPAKLCQLLFAHRVLVRNGENLTMFVVSSPCGILIAMQAATDVRAHILSYGQHLKDAVDTLRLAPEHWHTTLLIEIAGENLFSCHELVEGSTKGAVGVGRCAWGARSLLELHYFARFIMASPANARRFFEDMACDYQDLLQRWVAYPEHSQTISLNQAQLDYVWTQAQQTKKGDPYLSPRRIAKELGEEKPYADTHKYLSKFVHPTSLSIQFKKAPEIAFAVHNSIVETAARIVTHTFPLLAAHIRAHSVRTDG